MSRLPVQPGMSHQNGVELSDHSDVEEMSVHDIGHEQDIGSNHSDDNISDGIGQSEDLSMDTSYSSSLNHTHESADISNGNSSSLHQLPS